MITETKGVAASGFWFRSTQGQDRPHGRRDIGRVPGDEVGVEVRAKLHIIGQGIDRRLAGERARKPRHGSVEQRVGMPPPLARLVR